tara:strand:- start:78 stop:413 length:336 start_codon:yes stop_codon:yes gene_type:complete
MERLVLLALNVIVAISLVIGVFALLVLIEINLNLIARIVIGLVIFTLFFGLLGFVPKKWQQMFSEKFRIYVVKPLQVVVGILLILIALGYCYVFVMAYIFEDPFTYALLNY